ERTMLSAASEYHKDSSAAEVEDASPRNGLRVASVTTAPAIRNSANTTSPHVKLFVRVRTQPIRLGPTKPPRFPTELMSAIPAAAPVPANDSEDIAQNGPRVPHMPAAARESAASSSTGLVVRPAPINPAAPAMAESATCRRRSRVASECFDVTTINTVAAIHGIAARQPTRKSFMPEKIFTICGSQNVTP